MSKDTLQQLIELGCDLRISQQDTTVDMTVKVKIKDQLYGNNISIRRTELKDSRGEIIKEVLETLLYSVEQVKKENEQNTNTRRKS